MPQLDADTRKPWDWMSAAHRVFWGINSDRVSVEKFKMTSFLDHCINHAATVLSPDRVWSIMTPVQGSLYNLEGRCLAHYVWF